MSDYKCLLARGPDSENSHDLLPKGMEPHTGLLSLCRHRPHFQERRGRAQKQTSARNLAAWDSSQGLLDPQYLQGPLARAYSQLSRYWADSGSATVGATALCEGATKNAAEHCHRFSSSMGSFMIGRGSKKTAHTPCRRLGAACPTHSTRTIPLEGLIGVYLHLAPMTLPHLTFAPNLGGRH